MRHILKRFALVLILLFCGKQMSFGFALLGPINEAYQVNVIGYNLNGAQGSIATPNHPSGVDNGAPKNFKQGYRWNLTNIYYAYDTSFSNFFGIIGMAAADQAFFTYNSLSNVSSYTSNLSEWPFDSRRQNHAASALNLMDVKSTTMEVVIEELGLAQPDRWVWALHDRDVVVSPCDINYIVDQRNFDPVSLLYSPFVNGTLYGYNIVELCAVSPNPVSPFEADAVEYTTDPTTSFSAVADYAIEPGFFFTGFTRDDVGGLRALYAATNVNLEAAESNSVQLFTNTSPSSLQLLVTSNLAIFEQQALTNDGPTLETLYPGLIVLTTSNFFGLQITTNFTVVFSFPPNAPAGIGVVGLATTFTTNVVPLFSHTYANLEILHYYTNGYITTQQITLEGLPNAPAGILTLVTNTTTVLAPFTNGDFYILPTNLCGPYNIVSNLLTTVTGVTNIVVPTTNAPATITNLVSSTVQVITYTTNYFYSVYPVQCVTNSAAARQGVEKINFIRVGIDPLTGQINPPITNVYNLTAVIGGKAVTQTFRRIVRFPDMLFSAQDLTAGPSGATAVGLLTRSAPNWNTSQVATNEAGPGTIQPSVVVAYNNVGPTFINDGPLQADDLNGSVVLPGELLTTDANSVAEFQWATFDGSTNAPVIFPSTLSLQELEAAIYFQIVNGLLPTASVRTNNASNPYSVQLKATGGTPLLGANPYTWSLVAGSASLPAGLNLSSTGLISGVPTTTGIYQFTVQATDAASSVTEAVLFIVINP